MNPWVSSWVRYVAFAGLLAGLCACDSYGAYCEDAVKCGGGNDADVDACVEETEGLADLAALWGCDEYFDDLMACAEEHSRCENGYYTYEEACRNEQERYSACM